MLEDVAASFFREVRWDLGIKGKWCSKLHRTRWGNINLHVAICHST